MSEQPEQVAPDLGPGTDAQDVDAEGQSGSDDEQTIDTPDQLGGTGGQQPGGAG
ncbi:MAG: hypothetical protein V7636_2548 [Actinomycetota bacterium]|jgi:hypothetical protein